MALAILGCLSTQKSNAQVVFKEDFGSHTTRVTSSYMPSGSFTFANPYPTSKDYNQFAIDNGYYAVVAPTHIFDGFDQENSDPYYFWTLPSSGATITNNSSVIKKIIYGHTHATDNTGTSGADDDAVLVVNSGNVIKPFYRRTVNVESGSTYSLSFWMFVVNPATQGTTPYGSTPILMQVVYPYATDEILGEKQVAFYGEDTWSSNNIHYDSQLGTWQQFTYTFTVPQSCGSGPIAINLNNDAAVTGGNDYYIDDIELDKVGSSTADNSITCPTPLPVTLSSFSGLYNNGDVDLKWTTASEVNFNYFDIERSADGTNWSKMGTKMATGTSTTGADYSFTDYSPLSGNDYYRLKMVDLDGSVKYSSIITIATSDALSTTVKLYPNPVKKGNQLHIQMSSEKTESVNVRLINMAGQNLVAQQLTVNNGQNVLNIDIPSNAFGNVIVVVTDLQGKKLIQKPILIQ